MKTQPRSTPAREAIIEAAFRAMHLFGFQAATLNHILADTDLTKGALYHHFPNKLSLGYAVLEERIQHMIDHLSLRPLAQCEDPIETIKEILASARKTMSKDEILLGCPLNNLALEMSPVDEGFRQRVHHIYDLWTQALSDALSRAQTKGKVNDRVDPHRTATFIVATLAGCRSMAKNAQSSDVLSVCCDHLCEYLETLRLQDGSEVQDRTG